MGKNILRAVVLAVLALFTVSSVVLAYTYYAAIQVTETGGNSYTYLPYIVDVDNDYLADQNYIAATGLDTRVTVGGTELQHLVVDDSVLFVIPSLAANSSGNYRYELGESALSNMPIIVGSGGYITVSDDADLELGDDFEIEFDGYVDTSSGDSKFLFYKELAIACVNSDSEELKVAILPTYTSPTGHNDPGSDWIGETSAYNDNTGNYASCENININSWGDYLELTIDSIDIYGLRYYASGELANVDEIDVDIYYEEAWVDVFQGTFTHSTWEYESIYALGVTKARIRLYNDHDAIVVDGRLHDFDFITEGKSATVTGIASGVHTVKAYADGTNLGIIVDEGEAGETSDTTALIGASVTDNSNDIVIDQNDVMPYFDYITWTVSDTLIAWYQPVTMVADEVLPDREGAAENGTITWGSNPADTSGTIGQLISASQPSPGVIGGDNPEDILPSGSVPSGGVVDTEALESHPFYPAVSALNTMTGFTEEQVWFGGATIIIIMAMVFIALKFRGHLVICGISGLVLAGLFVAQGIYQWWMMIPFVGLFVVSILMERKPVI